MEGRDCVTLGLRPDPFQTEAMAHLDAGRSVLVCAPTGSGKTLIAEMAAADALSHGQRLFYTTPLKALSNQKYRDLGSLFGKEQIGLLTGDISIRADAPLLVMTTEVLRNMLLQPGCDHGVRTVRYIVLDECHYIGNYARGTIWEESILTCPPSTQLVALSATVANAAEVANWMNQVHPPTALVQTSERAVPLSYHYYRGGRLEPIVPEIESQLQPNRLQKRSPRFSSAAQRLPDLQDPSTLVEQLNNENLLPALYFTFSRRGCEISAESCSYLQLLDPDEQTQCRAIVEESARQAPVLNDWDFLWLLERGVGIHHAGMLPAWKRVVEQLFQQKLLKVVFATETMAAGINMPARTVVISSLRRPGERGLRPLAATEFHQMAGRAGRRGMDTAGHVVMPAESRISRADVQSLVSAAPEALGSWLTPGYSMVLNWLPRFGEERSARLIQSGFGPHSHLRASGDTDTLSLWKRFQAARHVLEAFGMMEGEIPSGLGVWTSSIFAENELLVALAVHRAMNAGVDLPAFAALLGAVSGAGSNIRSGRRRRMEPERIPTNLARSLDIASTAAAELKQVQHRCGFACRTSISRSLARIAYRWAGGSAWGDTLQGSDLDDGDASYQLRQVIDLARQIQKAPAADSMSDLDGTATVSISELGAAVAEAMDRSPVSEIE